MSKVQVEIDYQDRPMECCGLGLGSGFYRPVLTGLMTEYKAFALGDKVPKTIKSPETRVPTKEDQLARLNKLDELAEDNGRDTILICLSQDQETAIAAAKEHGYEQIFEFYNSNSGNMVYLFAKANYKTRADCGEEDDYDDWGDDD